MDGGKSSAELAHRLQSSYLREQFLLVLLRAVEGHFEGDFEGLQSIVKRLYGLILGLYGLGVGKDGVLREMSLLVELFDESECFCQGGRVG